MKGKIVLLNLVYSFKKHGVTNTGAKRNTTNQPDYLEHYSTAVEKHHDYVFKRHLNWGAWLQFQRKVCVHGRKQAGNGVEAVAYILTHKYWAEKESKTREKE